MPETPQTEAGRALMVKGGGPWQVYKQDILAIEAEAAAAERERLRGEVEALPDQFYGPRFRTAVLALLDAELGAEPEPSE